MGSYKSSLPLELLVFHKQGDNHLMQLVQPDSDNHTLSPLTYALKRHTTPLGTDFHPLHKSFTSFVEATQDTVVVSQVLKQL